MKYQRKGHDIGGPTGNMRFTGTAVVAALCVAASALLSGCGVDRSDYVADANKTCVSDQRGLDNKHKPKTTQAGIDYALNYFTDLDKAVSRLRELREPSSQADDLHRLWLDPAKRSLGSFYDTNLPLIRKASNDGDAATVHQQLQKLRHAAGQNVDQNYLRSVGLTGCLELFGRS